MTIGVNFATVTASIAALNITGVTVYDIDNIRTSAERITPALTPRPNEFITDITFNRVSNGGAGTAQMDFSYTLNYVYYHAPINSGFGKTIGGYDGMITNIAAIVKAIAGNDNISGAVDMQINAISNIGPVSDPAGVTFSGCVISLRISEFIQ